LRIVVNPVGAWEGHDWNRWREVTTWQKPPLTTEQQGRVDLVPLLGPNGSATDPSVRLPEWGLRRDGIQSTISAILGSPTGLTKPPVEVVDLGTENLDGYTRRHLKIRAEADDWIPAYLLVPKSLPAARVPAMLCLHQTVAQGKDEPCGIRGSPEMAFAVELVRRGFVCLAPDVIGFGERIPAGKQPYHDSLTFYRRHPGWSFFGKMIWDVGRMIDFLETVPQVDAKRIGSIGHSHGAYGTLFATAFEPRIAAAVASCGFTTFRADPHPNRWSHLTALLPQLGFYLPEVASIPFDWQHVLSLAAPRRLFVWYTARDTIFPNTENLEGLLKDLQSVYRAQGAEGNLAWEGFEGPHVFPSTAREKAYRWLEEGFGFGAGSRAERAPGVPSTNSPAASHKSASVFFPSARVMRAQANAQAHVWAAAIRDPLVAAAKPWLERSDEELWGLMFGNSLRRAWQVWSDGHCPACLKPVPMYEWMADALNHPWKMRCPQCRELFPKNDFQAFYRSGLNREGLFDPARADRSLLFHADHRDAADPLHRFGVDDGDGYVDGAKRWRFINAYLIFGQWKQAIVSGIRNLAAAYVATGDRRYAHKAGVLLDRVADVYPTFDFGKEGVMYEGPPRSGYVSTWHDACVEVLDLALAYDAVFEGMAADPTLATFLSAQAEKHGLGVTKKTFAEIQERIEERIFRDTLRNRPKIESNYPATDVTIVTLRTVLDWASQRAEVVALLDAIVAKATAVDGLTGEKGITGYSVIAPHAIAALLGRYARVEAGFLPDMLRRHPRLRAMYRFHLDTWCLEAFYPRTGDTGSFGERTLGYAGLPFTRNPGVQPSSYAFLWELYRATGDVDFVRLIRRSNGGTTDGLPFDLFADDPGGFQREVGDVLKREGADIRLGSVNKAEWGLAILRSGEGAKARAAWLDYDAGERHGHADGMTIGLFAKGLDLLPDFGYPPVQFGGWLAPRAVWYTRTAAHNTVAVDGTNHRAGVGKVTLWLDGKDFRVVRASAPQLIGGREFERTLAMIDTSDADSYLIDRIRVEGGREHIRFHHGTFGKLATQGLNSREASETRFGAEVRSFRRDENPVTGWSVDWDVDDHLKQLSAPADVHLRLTDFTPRTAVDTAEAWVAVGLYGGTADAWIPSVLTRRQDEKGPLSSTFVSVLEPYQDASRLGPIRRLSLVHADGSPGTESEVGLEIPLVQRGGRDVWVAANPTGLDMGGNAGERGPILVDPENGLRLEGEMAWVRFSAANEVTRVVLCRARSLRVGKVHVRLKASDASVELDLTRPREPVVAGSPEALEFLEVNGERLGTR